MFDRASRGTFPSHCLQPSWYRTVIFLAAGEPAIYFQHVSKWATCVDFKDFESSARVTPLVDPSVGNTTWLQCDPNWLQLVTTGFNWFHLITRWYDQYIIVWCDQGGWYSLWYDTQSSRTPKTITDPRYRPKSVADLDFVMNYPDSRYGGKPAQKCSKNICPDQKIDFPCGVDIILRREQHFEQIRKSRVTRSFLFSEIQGGGGDLDRRASRFAPRRNHMFS